MSLFQTGTESSAALSPCGLYRYTLSRAWGGGPTCNFIMLNPSKADASRDDPTIRRCVGYARSWGFGRLVVTNLFAFRATDPDAMKAAADPVGPLNDEHVRIAARRAGKVVCAWGNHGAYRARGLVVKLALAKAGVSLHALRLSKQHQPVHPLYLPADLQPVAWEEQPR